jgi:pimeloyl-ACP methyl ester carboxylesterase
MKITNFLTLPDNRQLAYAEFGKPDGHPVLYFHGGASCRLEPLLWGDDTISRLGLRLIAPDRPGMGQSDFQPDYGFSDWVKDLVCLADALGLDKFSVLGVSGGGGYAIACAAKIPERLHAAVIASGAWKTDAIAYFPTATRLTWILVRKFPLLNLLILKLRKQSFKASPEQLSKKLKKWIPPVDYAVVEASDRIKILREISIESMRQGVKGAAWDVYLYLQEWDFRVNEIQMPLKFFHGEQDMNIPIALAEQVVASLPMAELVKYPKEGHLSLIVNHFDAIAKMLVSE